MTAIRISNQTASAMLTQMVRGGKAEINVLLGDLATMPISPVDEGAMRQRVEEALAGLHPDVTASCIHHLGAVHSCPMDVALLQDMGLDPAIISYIVTSMGALDVIVQGSTIHFSQGPARLHFDLPIGEHEIWTAADRRSLYLDGLPATVVSVIEGRIGEGRGILTDVIRHPVLDREPLMMEGVRLLSSGGVIITIAEHPAVTDVTLRKMLEKRTA